MLVPRPASGQVTTRDGARIPYIQMGKGSLPVVLIQGVEDGSGGADGDLMLAAAAAIEDGYS